jgi:hypothetical protein
MATDANIKLPGQLLAQAQAIAQQEGKSVDDLATEAVDKLVKDRHWERMKREANQRRGSMTDEQVQEYVDKVIHDYRREQRER